MIEPTTGRIDITPPYQPDIELLPRQELDMLRECLLAQTVARAMGAPFFRDRLTAWETLPERMSVEEFQERVPLTSKQDLREARESAWVSGARERIALVLGTSGTTGTRIALPYTEQDLQQWWKLVARTLWTNGVRPHDVALLPVPVGLFTGGHAMLGGLLRLGCAVLPIGPAAPPVIIEALRGGLGVMPTVVVTLPSYLLRLLDAFPRESYDPAGSPLALASLGAEPWTEATRRRIEVGYQLRAVDSYGIGEMCGPGIAAECELRSGLHIWEDAFFAEIIDPDTGEPVPDGASGELVLTSLFREAFPLLRYRTGDASYIIPEPCSCRRTHRRMARIFHRLDKVLVISGVNIDPHDIEQLLFVYRWIGNEFLIEAGGAHHDVLIVHIERKPNEAMPPEASELLTTEIRRFFAVRVQIEIHEPGTLERVPGKAQRIRRSGGEF